MKSRPSKAVAAEREVCADRFKPNAAGSECLQNRMLATVFRDKIGDFAFDIVEIAAFRLSFPFWIRRRSQAPMRTKSEQTNQESSHGERGTAIFFSPSRRSTSAWRQASGWQRRRSTTVWPKASGSATPPRALPSSTSPRPGPQHSLSTHDATNATELRRAAGRIVPAGERQSSPRVSFCHAEERIDEFEEAKERIGQSRYDKQHQKRPQPTMGRGEAAAAIIR
jgi:hypothetical protein